MLGEVFGEKVMGAVTLLESKTVRWQADEFACGSYSYLPNGAGPADRKLVADKHGELVYFAGEATEQLYPSTVHGAYMSGKRVGKEVKKVLGGEDGGSSTKRKGKGSGRGKGQRSDAGDAAVKLNA